MGGPRAGAPPAARRLSAPWFRLLARLRVYRRLLLMETPIAGTPPTRPIALAVDVREGGAADLADYFALRPDAEPRDIRDRVARGERWFGVWHEGRLVSALWAATGRARLGYLARTLELGPGEAYAYDSFTAEAYRGRELATLRSTLMERTLAADGVRRILLAILPENAFQERRGLKRNRRPLAVIGYVGLGPWRRHFLRPLPNRGQTSEAARS